MVNTFYDLVTDFYEWGWGQSFHFAPRFKGEGFHESIKRLEYFVALRYLFFYLKFAIKQVTLITKNINFYNKFLRLRIYFYKFKDWDLNQDRNVWMLVAVLWDLVEISQDFQEPEQRELQSTNIKLTQETRKLNKRVLKKLLVQDKETSRN